jgi:catechol 2,3-dioxygenase-like lactoylglutathione lyase family enzyme
MKTHPAFRPRSSLLLALPLLAGLACQRASASEAVAAAVESVTMTVSDMDRSLRFYHDVLGFELASDVERAGDDYEHLVGVFGSRVRLVTLRLGDETLQLEQFISSAGRPIPADSRSNDGWFQHVAIIVSDMDRAYAWLRERHVEQSSPAPQLLPAWNPNAGGISAFYFRDPDGHNLEVLHFPPGKGDAKWQRHTEALFLGIDHTAIVVANTDESLQYYQDALGLHVVGKSENFGPEQERLNNVFGARLRITALRGSSGPGVELLEYLAPRTGRPMPVDTRENDVWSWHVTLKANVAAADAAIRRGHYSYVSPGPIMLGEAGATGLLVRDPDGHAALLMQGR